MSVGSIDLVQREIGLGAVNPLHQVPVIILEDGTILTETAAITLYLADRHVDLPPARDTPERNRFYRLLVWLVANIYPTFTYGDYPERWVSSAPAELNQATARYREKLYLWLEEQVSKPFVLGTEVGALNVYVAVLVAWHPHLDWFHRHTRRIAQVAERTRQLPPITEVMTLNAW